MNIIFVSLEMQILSTLNPCKISSSEYQFKIFYLILLRNISYVIFVFCNNDLTCSTRKRRNLN